MGKISILLCDSDQVYIKRLGAGLTRQLSGRLSVRTCGSLKAQDESETVQILLSGICPSDQWRERHPQCCCLHLCEDREEEAAETGFWMENIYKYQAISKILGRLEAYLPASLLTAGLSSKNHMRCFGVISAVKHSAMVPFACALARELSQEYRVLLVVLVEFCGLQQLLEIRQEQDLEEYLFAMRQKSGKQDLTLPPVLRMDGFDLLLGPANPMVLYEMNPQDTQDFIGILQDCREYDALVWVSGHMFQGIGEWFRCSKRLYFVEKTDHYSRCCQQELKDFYNKLQAAGPDRLIPVSLPSVKETSPGGHLLWQWSNSVMGDKARQLLKGETADGDTAKEDFRPAGSKRGDLR